MNTLTADDLLDDVREYLGAIAEAHGEDAPDIDDDLMRDVLAGLLEQGESGDSDDAEPVEYSLQAGERYSSVWPGRGWTYAGRGPRGGKKWRRMRAVKKTPDEDSHEYSSTQFNLPEDIAGKMLALAEKISDDDLAEGGREDEPHVTVKYGLHTVKADDVERVVKDFGPVKIKLGKTSFFPAKDDGEDVVKIDVESEGLRRLNKLISEKLDCTDTHPEYVPHVTLAYVKAGKGEKYVSEKSLDVELTLTEMLFSSPDGEQVTIPLGKAKDAEDDELSETSEPVEYVLQSWQIVYRTSRGEPVLYATAHAPAGGIDIGGEHFEGGEFITGDVVAKGTKEEKAAIKSGAPKGKKPPKVKAEKGRERMIEAIRADADDKGEARVILKNGQPAPPHITAAHIGKDWTDVQISLDPEADVLVIAKDEKGRPKTVYSDKWDDGASARKFARVSEMMEKREEIAKEVQAARKGDKKEQADCAFLIEQQGTRPGSDADTKGLNQLLGVDLSPADVVAGKIEDEKTGELKDAMFLRIKGQYVHVKDEGTAEQLRAAREAGDVQDSDYWIKSFGATTLEARHVVEAPDGVRLQFVGKEGVWHDHLVKDKRLAAMLVERKKAAKDDCGRLFKTTETKLNKFIGELDGGLFTAKDFRTKRANEIAINEVKNRPKPATMKEYKAAVLEVGKAASHVLGNDPTMALASYVNPAVFSGWFAGLSAEERALADKPKKGKKGEKDADAAGDGE